MTTLSRPIFPDHAKRLSGSALKVIAVVSMIIDHCAVLLVPRDKTVFSSGLTWYELMRFIGRMAFPIFCFLLIEGFRHTSDVRKYALRLLFWACLTEIPWYLLRIGQITPSRHNVLFTLLFGLIALICIERWKEDALKSVLPVVLLLVAAFFFKADYGALGVLFILILYRITDYPLLQILAGIAFLPDSWRTVPAFIPINLYNGERGFIRGRTLQTLFYAIYPAHLLLIWLILRFK